MYVNKYLSKYNMQVFSEDMQDITCIPNKEICVRGCMLLVLDRNRKLPLPASLVHDLRPFQMRKYTNMSFLVQTFHRGKWLLCIIHIDISALHTCTLYTSHTNKIFPLNRIMDIKWTP